MAQWLVRQDGSEPIGPVATELVLRAIEAGRLTSDAEVCRAGDHRWLPIDMVPEFAGVVFDDQGPTHVTDSPWFTHEPESSVRRSGRGPPPAPPPAPAPPQRRQMPAAGLGLPAPPRAPMPSSTLPARAPPPLPPPSRSKPAPSTRVIVPAQSAYGDVDDEAATRVATPPSEQTSSDEFPVDDETMTRVQGNRRPDAPAGSAAPQRRAGVLPTLPMQSLEAALAQREGVISPRPAAGAPPPVSVRADLLVPPTQPLGNQDAGAYAPPGTFPPVPGQQAPTPLPPGYGSPGQGAGPYGPTLPPYGGGYFHPSPPPGQMPPHPNPYGTQPPNYHVSQGDQGLKALVALIVFLAVALAIVLVLLFVRQ